MASIGVPANSAAASSAFVPDRYSRVVPALRGGGRTMPPSTQLSPRTAPMARAVAGETAFASITSARLPASERATSNAACGGQMDRITCTSSKCSVACRPASSARRAVAALRPDGLQSTWCPRSTRSAPTAAPISPGCSRPTFTIRNDHRHCRTPRVSDSSVASAAAPGWRCVASRE
jgi:hypothetical protein